MSKIILVGYMGVGKTEIGQLLSKRNNLPFYDLDDEIEKACSMSINQIFESKGEIFFRKIEHEILKQLMNTNKSFILSLGGGTPCYANNHEFLRIIDVNSIYLKANVSTLQMRLKNNSSNRPLINKLSENELTEFIAKHLFERNYYYNMSKNTIPVDNKAPKEIVAEIEKILF